MPTRCLISYPVHQEIGFSCTSDLITSNHSPPVLQELGPSAWSTLTLLRLRRTPEGTLSSKLYKHILKPKTNSNMKSKIQFQLSCRDDTLDNSKVTLCYKVKDPISGKLSIYGQICLFLMSTQVLTLRADLIVLITWTENNALSFIIYMTSFSISRPGRDKLWAVLSILPFQS